MRVRTAVLALWACVSGLATASPSLAQGQAVRAEVPIREVILGDGTRRYGVRLQLGGMEVEAGLDTGSTGLRVLPAAVASGAARTVGPDQRYGYGAGTMLEGPEAQSEAAVGALAGRIRFQAVKAVGCAPNRPHCPVEHLPPADYRIQGNGRPGEGFYAILGTSLVEANLPNPLVDLGARRWIVELPRPGEGAPGRLILNPDPAETQGFVPLARTESGRGPGSDALQACLVGPPEAPAVCAPTIIDSGAPGIEVVNRKGAPWPDGTPARLLFGRSPEAAAAGVGFEVGRRSQASHLQFVQDDRVPGGRIRSGLIAYFAYDVLYDADHAAIAVRARPPYPDGARGLPPGGG